MMARAPFARTHPAAHPVQSTFFTSIPPRRLSAAAERDSVSAAPADEAMMMAANTRGTSQDAPQHPIAA